MRLPNGRDLNVSLRDLAPAPDRSMLSDLPEHNMTHHETAVQSDVNANNEPQKKSSNSLSYTMFVESEIDK